MQHVNEATDGQEQKREQEQAAAVTEDVRGPAFTMAGDSPRPAAAVRQAAGGGGGGGGGGRGRGSKEEYLVGRHTAGGGGRAGPEGQQPPGKHAHPANLSQVRAVGVKGCQPWRAGS